MYSKKINSPNDLEIAAKELITAFSNDRVFAFYGKMGAGKTTFIQSVCRALGSDDNVTSPTFALINEYNTADLDSIFHFDFYRIKDIEEAYDLGYEDYIYSGSYCLIEWPEMIESLLPEKMVEVKIEVLEDNTRLITAQEI
ncbi:tRNA threonylcarbamoyladenosine biosynthesis protein TsaE [Draconibacterium orientale]|uniref:tRNA threonylcarbamoyladenosine biosynthesis protein TsaE n=1 Tax=Draconibacterium orientale TaxID=1168034 RepID=X5DW55_9BACT|nr:tRNA (adenosine(37)-N6)-threonylcarbamoyltransferase complex ATPase subunit type 1 TsaE [Draconibacterium orientale]AHW59440.1 ATP/GTP hydrolase [Draconibacterium orientale]SET27641.1 tRNA threonylcarbamoyladenosine biosynthesis protein TsaE [Draconibacterium orientale]